MKDINFVIILVASSVKRTKEALLCLKFGAIPIVV